MLVTGLQNIKYLHFLKLGRYYRFDEPPLDKGVSNLCNIVVEDEIHFS